MWEVKKPFVPRKETIMPKKSTKEAEINNQEISIEKVKETEKNVVTTSLKKPLAKTGKRSLKAIQAEQAKELKEARKQENISKKISAQEEKKTKPVTPRSHLQRHSKSYLKHYIADYKNHKYSLEQATQEIIKTNPVKFDATVELHIRLSVDPKQADQNIRDSVILPAGTGKSVRIAAFVDDNDRLQAIDSGADLAGETEITKELNSGKFSFNVLLSTPNMMPKLGKFARVLGPRGLMPNPKSGTVTNDIIKAISESKTGKVEYRVDSNGIIHLGIGKVSFKPNQLLENLQAVLGSIQANKPSSLKNNYIMSAYLSTSMGPSIKLDI